MAHITIIRPPIIQPKHHVTSLRAVPSIGISYLQAALKKAGHQVTMIDAPGEALFNFRDIKGTNLTVNGLNADEILSRIPEETDYIGISFMHANEYIYDRFIARKVRQKFPAIPLIGGGENATGSASTILNDKPTGVSCIVLGQGEKAMVDVIEAYEKSIPFSQVSNVAYKTPDGGIVHNDRKTVLKEIDDFELPDWTGIPLEKYFKAQTGISSHSERSLTMLATRGCPYACTFCTVPGMWGSKWKSRDPKKVVEEIIHYQNQYQITHIDFIDLTFALNKKWVRDFCQLLIDKNVNINWSLPIGTRTESLDNDILALMKQAGCVRILFSPESGSKETLFRINKKLDIMDVNNAIVGSVQNGLIVKLATIFGFPGQTKREVVDTMFFLVSAAFRGVHDVVCLHFVPYPGTELRTQLVNEDKLDENDFNVRLNNDVKNMVSYSEHIPSWSLKYISLFGMALFYGMQFLIRPWRFFIAFNNIFIKRFPRTNFESILYCHFFRNVIDLNHRLGAEDIDMSEAENQDFPNNDNEPHQKSVLHMPQ